MVLRWRRRGRAGGCQIIWGCSSVGRAPALQAGGREFESLCLHGIEIKLFRFKKTRVAKRSGRNIENRAAISRSNLLCKLCLYLENWTLKIISSINIKLVRDRKISNNEIGRWKEVAFRSSKTRDIRGHWVTSMEKQSNLRTTRSAEQRYAKQTRRE